MKASGFMGRRSVEEDIVGDEDGVGVLASLQNLVVELLHHLGGWRFVWGV